jgi:membrane protease YdiL (CAAX protease family)
MRAAVIVVGIVAQMVSWWAISSGRVTVWRLMPFVLGAMALVALLVLPSPERTTGVGRAVVVGLASGLALFLATRVFVAIASHWRPFARHVEEAYRAAADEPIGAVLGLSLLISAAEEVFYRGLVQRALGETALGAGTAALVTLVAYALANLTSRSLPIVAGAVVGGAVWGALAWWSGGIAGPLASHILWTGLMLVLPPGAGREVSR